MSDLLVLQLDEAVDHIVGEYTTSGQEATVFIQLFGYRTVVRDSHDPHDDLYRLEHVEGNFEYRQGRFHTYTMDMKYDNIHNIEQKTQVHNIEGGNKVQAQRGTSYDWTYDYAGKQPHAPTHIGNRSFSYDANGNQTGWTHDNKGTRRNIIWDDENRVMEIQDPSHTLRFKYDAGGQRIIKQGQQGRTVYVNQYYVVKNGATVSKHIFAGTTRLATALIHGKKPQRVSGSNDTGTTSTYSGTDTDTSTSQKGKGKGKGKQDKPNKGKATGQQTTAASDNAETHAGKSGKSHPGRGNDNRSERANEVAQNTVKNPNLNGQGHPGQDINKRSDKAKERSRNLEQNPHAQANETPEDPWVSDTGSLKISKFMYFYHPDHLGSTSYVTDGNGALYEHVAYFPFGESWVTEARNGNNIDYLFTSKEMDSETGLYYYGARYYDPRTSVWQSADPVLEEYLPNVSDWIRAEKNEEEYKPEESLRGMGGIYKPINLAVYTYSFENPVIFTDPDGNSGSYLLPDGSGPKSFIQDKNGNVRPVYGEHQQMGSPDTRHFTSPAKPMSKESVEAIRKTVDEVSSAAGDAGTLTAAIGAKLRNPKIVAAGLAVSTAATAVNVLVSDNQEKAATSVVLSLASEVAEQKTGVGKVMAAIQTAMVFKAFEAVGAFDDE